MIKNSFKKTLLRDRGLTIIEVIIAISILLFVIMLTNDIFFKFSVISKEYLEEIDDLALTTELKERISCKKTLEGLDSSICNSSSRIDLKDRWGNIFLSKDNPTKDFLYATCDSRNFSIQVYKKTKKKMRLGETFDLPNGLQYFALISHADAMCANDENSDKIVQKFSQLHYPEGTGFELNSSCYSLHPWVSDGHCEKAFLDDLTHQHCGVFPRKVEAEIECEDGYVAISGGANCTGVFNSNDGKYGGIGMGPGGVMVYNGPKPDQNPRSTKWRVECCVYAYSCLEFTSAFVNCLKRDKMGGIK